MPDNDFFRDAHAQYFIEYSLRTLLSNNHYRLDEIDMCSERIIFGGEMLEVLAAHCRIVNLATGKISYPVIYPRYFSDNYEKFIGKCDDLHVRFSILFDKSGFFTPCWISVIRGKQSYSPEGSRLDWDRNSGKGSFCKREEYRYLKERAKNSTQDDNVNVVERCLPIWLEKCAVLNSDD